MNLNFTDEESRDIENIVNYLTLTKEEYFLNLHKKILSLNQLYMTIKTSDCLLKIITICWRIYMITTSH